MGVSQRIVFYVINLKVSKNLKYTVCMGWKPTIYLTLTLQTYPSVGHSPEKEQTYNPRPYYK